MAWGVEWLQSYGDGVSAFPREAGAKGVFGGGARPPSVQPGG